MSGNGSLAVNAAILGERPTGVGLYALHLVRALAGVGEPLVVFTSVPDAFASLGADVRPLPPRLRPEGGGRAHLMRALWVQSTLRMMLRRVRPRALLNLWPEALLAPPLPQATVVHDVLPLHYPHEYPRLRHYFRHVVPAVLRQSRAVLTISESTRRDLLRFYDVPAERVHVVFAGYDADRFSPHGEAAPSGVEPYALYVGNVMPHKNLLRLVDAFARAVARVPGTLVIRGSGRADHVEALRERIAASGLADRVDWRPYAPDDELPRLYRGARAVLLPSLYEGFGLPALEAMACGAPVIASNVSSLPEVVGDAALLVDPINVEALAAAIARLFADDRLAKDLRERGLARAARFSWARTGRAVQAALRAAVGEPS